MVTLEKLPPTIYLKTDFRNSLFCRAYSKAGSLAGIGTAMGYRSRAGLNGVPRDMWLGRSGISRKHIDGLLKLTSVSLDELCKNIIAKEESEQLDNWMTIYQEYKNTKTIRQR
jgi:hypothetical protein